MVCGCFVYVHGVAELFVVSFPTTALLLLRGTASRIFFCIARELREKKILFFGEEIDLFSLLFCFDTDLFVIFEKKNQFFLLQILEKKSFCCRRAVLFVFSAQYLRTV